MEEIAEFIRGSIQDIVDRSKQVAFRSEDQIQGFFEARAAQVLPDGLEYVAEHPTNVKYVRENGYLRQSGQGRRGRLDAVIKSASEAVAGIEIEYPRGQGIRNREFFVSHVVNDITKLADYDGLRERFLLVFMYDDPPDATPLKVIHPREHAVNAVLLRLAKKKDKKGIAPVRVIDAIPDGWISCRSSEIEVRIR